MRSLRLLARRLRAIFRPAVIERELEAEIAFHIEEQTAANIHDGMSAAEARRQALLVFGGIEQIKESHRDGRGARWLEEAVADIRYAARALRRHPLLGTTIIATLAIAIGANTTIYAAVHAVIVRPLPFHEADRLVMVSEENPEKGWHLNISAGANFLDWKEQVAGFQDVMAYSPFVSTVTLTGAGEPRVLKAYRVTGNFFSVLGVRPALGQTLNPAEVFSTGPLTAVLSDRAWKAQFLADPAVVGKTVQLNSREYQIVGVMPPTFGFPAPDADVWTALTWIPSQRSLVSFRRAHQFRTVARLARGVSPETANAQLQAVVQRLQRDYPATNKFMGAGFMPLHDFLVGPTRTPLLILLGAVGMLLLIACANVGNLLLVQVAERSRESALRLALGARPGRLMRQALAESLTLSLLGGAAGLVIGWVGTRILLTLQPGGLLPVDQVGITAPVVGFVFGITLVSGMLFTITPMLWQRNRSPGEALKEGGRSTGTGRRMRHWGSGLVVSELALASILTIGAGLLVHSFRELERVDPGFNPDGVLTIAMNVPGARYSDAGRISGFYGELVRRVQALPGVQSAAVTSGIPVSGGVGWTSDFTALGRAPDGYGSDVAHRAVSPDYFHTMQVPLKKGRFFTADDNLENERVVLINEALARSYFRNQDPVGQRITFDRVPDSTSTWRTIIGVVGDERQSDLATPSKIEFITPELQAPATFMNLVTRTTGDPLALTAPIQRVAASIDPLIAFTSAQSMTDVRDQSLARQRFLTVLLLAFAVAGLFLAAVSVYGVMAQMARGRRREMGIRMALGARPSTVQWLVIGSGLRLAVAGVGLGLAVAFLTTRLMTTLLFNVDPTDPIIFGAVPLVLILTALIASWVPAATVGRADPMETLRRE